MRNTLKGSELIALIQAHVERYGDNPVFLTDGFFRYGIQAYSESAPNFDAPKAILVRPFSLETGMDGPDKPMEFRGAPAKV